MDTTNRDCNNPVQSESDNVESVQNAAVVLVANIQEIMDRCSHMETVFVNQLYPVIKENEDLQNLEDQWNAKERDLLLHIEMLIVEKQQALEENRLLKLDRDKPSKQKEEKIDQLQLSNNELERMLNQKSKEVDEGIESCNRLLQVVESKEAVIMDKEKQLKESEDSRNVLLAKVSDLEKRVGELQQELLTKKEEFEGCLRERSLLLSKITGLEDKVNELQVDPRCRASEEAKGRDLWLHQQIESLTSDLVAERNKYGHLIASYKNLKSQHAYLRTKCGLTRENMLSHNKLEGESDLLRNDQSPAAFNDIGEKIQHASAAACDNIKIKNDTSIKKREKLIPATSPFSSTSSIRVAPKCSSTVKPAPVASRKRRASCWVDTRSNQGQNRADAHDDFLDTPMEGIRENLNKVLKEKVTDLPGSGTIPVPVQNDEIPGISDDETQDFSAVAMPRKQPMPVTVAGKNGFKYVEPVRKKADRENLKGVDCKQCKKFYDAVIPNDGGKDNDNSKHNFRCEHHEGVSRHRYRYLPPSTPEGFWNIGFESEM